MNIWPNITSANDIPGWTTDVQHELYKDVANLLPQVPNVLEIGCGWGRSTWAWLNVLPSDTKFFILDTFGLTNEYLFFASKLIDNKEEFYQYARYVEKENIQHRDIFDKIIQQHPKFYLIEKIWQENTIDWFGGKDVITDWDLVYYDGDHDYQAVKDMLRLFEHVPVVCGDDYAPDFQGTIDAITEYANEKTCSVEILPGRFWMIKNEV
tara:strand:- start:2887 stop:3513 length:627 start_codon:yes stop_codon:yes gene_type:complete